MDAADRAIRRDGIGLGAAVGVFGLSFGTLAVAAGLSTAQACVLSLVMFTGGSQLAYVGVLGAGGSASAAALSAILLGSRNTLYGVSVGPLLGLRRWLRPLAAHWTIDETTAMATGHGAAGGSGSSGSTLGRHRARVAFAVTGAAVFVFWNLATLAGALLGHAVGDPGRFGLDAVGPAAFLALLWPRLRGTGNSGDRRVALVGAVLALTGAVLLPTGLAVPLAALAVLVALPDRNGQHGDSTESP